jgi:hypothetical protein
MKWHVLCVCVCVYMSAPVYWSPLILFLDSVCNFLRSFSHLHCILPTNLPTFLTYVIQGQITSSSQSRPLYNRLQLTFLAFKAEHKLHSTAE